MAYRTKQQQAVLRCLEERPEAALSAVEIAEALREGGERVGLATIYRQLDKLAALGLAHKVSTDEGALYQYCPHHEDHHDCFLLHCTTCGSIVHLDCSHLQGLYQHLEQEHHFRIDSRRTVLTGLCARCMEQEAAQ